MTRTVCTVEGCGKREKGRGFCERHLWRLRKHGDPCGGGVDEGAPLRWLEDNVNYNADECLIWPFGRNHFGYAAVYWRGRAQGAHRVMLCLAVGEPPSVSHEGAHSCGRGTSGCVSPKHLSWKTHLENMRDRIRHGTSNRGTTNGQCRLSDQQAREVKLALAHGDKVAEIAERFDVSVGAIRNIKSGRNWAWLILEAA